MTEQSSRFAHLKGVALTDIGRKRKNNEDSFGAFPSHGIWCVADGMGGGDDGEVASAAVVKSVDAYLSDLPTAGSGAYAGSQIAAGVISAVEDASGWIFRRTRNKKLKGCGSTFVGIVFDATAPDAAIALHVGDSRLYRLRGKELRQITKDHSVAEMMGAKDEKELNPMFRGMILRAVGIESSVEIDKTPLSVNAGDVVLICSDGLSRMVPDKRICEIIREGGDGVEATAKRLIAEANAAGGVDNITVVLVKVGALPPPQSVVSIAQGEDSLPSSSTLRTLDREYGKPRWWLSRSVLIGIAVAIAAAAFGWAISLSFTRARHRPLATPFVESIPTGEKIPARTNVADRPAIGATAKGDISILAVGEASCLPMTRQDAAPTNVAVGTVGEASCLPMTRQDAAPTNVAVGTVGEASCLPMTRQDAAPTMKDVSILARQDAAPTSAETKEDRERDAVEEELRAERERRKRADEAAAKDEQMRRQVAQELAATYDRSFVDFAWFVNAAFGKGASDRAYSLCRQLHACSKDAGVSMFATDFTAEVKQLAGKLIEKYGAKSLREDSAAAALVSGCRMLVDMDPATPAAQRKCLELMDLVAKQRRRNDGRK